MTQRRLHPDPPTPGTPRDASSAGRSVGPEPAGRPANEAATQPLRSEDLLGGHPAIAIAHNGALYRLQTTRQGKLILTK